MEFSFIDIEQPAKHPADFFTATLLQLLSVGYTRTEKMQLRKLVYTAVLSEHSSQHGRAGPAVTNHEENRFVAFWCGHERDA
jgi:hypothetical protein